MKKLLILLFLLFLSGCGPGISIDNSIADYKKVSQKIELGDSKQNFLNIIYSSQSELSAGYSKEPEKYIKNDVKVEIYYMRSGRQPDGLSTDDEFTPYVFNDGILVGIGWAILGGPKTQGQTTSNTYNSSSSSVVIY